MYEPEPEYDVVFSLSDDSSVPCVWDETTLRELEVPVRRRTPLDRAKPRDGETDETVDGDVRPVWDSVGRVDVGAPR